MNGALSSVTDSDKEDYDGVISSGKKFTCRSIPESFRQNEFPNKKRKLTINHLVLLDIAVSSQKKWSRNGGTKSCKSRKVLEAISKLCRRWIYGTWDFSHWRWSFVVLYMYIYMYRHIFFQMCMWFLLFCWCQNDVRNRFIKTLWNKRFEILSVAPIKFVTLKYCTNAYFSSCVDTSATCKRNRSSTWANQSVSSPSPQARYLAYKSLERPYLQSASTICKTFSISIFFRPALLLHFNVSALCLSHRGWVEIPRHAK